MWQRHVRTLFFIVMAVALLGGNALAERVVVINIPAFTLYVYDDGTPVRSFPISIGTELNPSVLGETTIMNKVVNPTYYPPEGREPVLPGPENPVGTRWLGLGFAGYGIHGTNQPASIGSPASSGCIRMLNRDVEELTDLVQIGTTVRLIYQTVLLDEDPLLHTKTITVYPDVYKQGISQRQLQEELARSMWSGVHWPALLTLLRVPTGEPYPLPWQCPLIFDGKQAEVTAVEWNGEFFLPFDLPFDPRSEMSLATVKWGDEYFLPLEAYLHYTGLGYSKAQGQLRLHSPLGYVGERSLGQALIFQEEIYLRMDEPVRLLMPLPMQVVSLWGEIYQPARSLLAADHLQELRLEWPKQANSSR